MLGGPVVRAIIVLAGQQHPDGRGGATPTSGACPSASSSRARAPATPTAIALLYEWDFGDGTTSTAANPSHVYQIDGKYTALLRVSDSHGRSATDTVVISAGNSPPTATIAAPAAGRRSAPGRACSSRGPAPDVQDGALGGSGLRWDPASPRDPHPSLRAVHRRVHELRATDDHDSDSYYEVTLTATNSRGLCDTASVNVRPQTSA